MWYPATVTVAATAEPVTLVEAKRQCRVDHDDDNTQIEFLIESARAHAEKYTNTRLATQTVTVKCDSFCDMARLPLAPVQSVSSVTYVDVDGVTQTLSTDVYETRTDGLESSITLKYGQSWPAIRNKSRITVTAVVGYETPPPDVRHAMLLFISETFNQRANAKVEDWTALDALLSNHRYGA